jgi:NAD(P)-dependent dehydrogenase (short-subunit alcohol dehydrogenase family)
MKLEGKVAVVTGAGSGIGRATVLRLAKEGADIVVDDINIEAAKGVADEIKAIGRKALAIKADVTNSKEVDEMFKTVLSELGKVDILVNNAGGHYRDEVTEFRYSREEIWDLVLARNLKGTLICSRAVINHMIERGSGKIVNIASITGVYGSPRAADFSAAKTGVIGFTRALASEVGQYGVNVNCIVPGLIGAPHVLSKPLDDLPTNILTTRIIKRIGETDEIASAVLFLVSDDASYVMGHTLVVDGGTTL